MSLSIEIDGDKELVRVLSGIPKKFPEKVLFNIARKATAPIVNDARRNVGIDGSLDAINISKKVVRAVKDKDNPTVARVTISNNYVSYKGKKVSLGKVYRHLTAGPQEDRKTQKGKARGKVNKRSGDFIERAFNRKKERSLKIIKTKSEQIIKKALAKYL